MKVLSPVEIKQVSAGWKPGDLLFKFHKLMMKIHQPYLTNSKKYSPYSFPVYPHYSF